jgi:hypothetical protein
LLGRRDAADLGDEALLRRRDAEPGGASCDLVVEISEELGLGTPRTASAAASFQLGRRELLLLGESRLVTPLGRRDL